MMNRKVTFMVLVAGGLALPLAAYAYTGEELAPQAKVDLQSARAIALKASPGQIQEVEHEKEEGGSGLRYSFVILKSEKPWEVGIDAMTGEVLENQAEGPNPD